MQSLLFCNNLGLAYLSVGKIAFGGVGFQLREYVPDSGQEHTADGNDGFLVTTTSLEPAIALFAFSVLVGFDDSIRHLNQERFEVSPGTRDAGKFAFAAALVVARTATRPRTEIFRRRKHGHIHADFSNDCDSSHWVVGKTGAAVITQGFKLPAKFIIHTAGPVYRDGKHGEEDFRNL